MARRGASAVVAVGALVDILDSTIWPDCDIQDVDERTDGNKGGTVRLKDSCAHPPVFAVGLYMCLPLATPGQIVKYISCNFTILLGV